MKTQLKLLVFAMAFISILFQATKIAAQYCGPFVAPPRFELQTNSPLQYIFLNTGIGTCATGAATLPGVGINFAAPNAPNYMLDILSNLYVGDGVNVSNMANKNAVGYSIGGALNRSGILYPQMFLWHSGDTTSVYCGIHAGYSTPQAFSVVSYNTFVGNGADINYAGSGGIWNTAVGYDALTSNTGGVSGSNYYGCKNVAV
jgi:hypothetical protein